MASVFVSVGGANATANPIDADYLGFDGPGAGVDVQFADLPNLQEYFHDDFFTGTLELLYRADTDVLAAKATQ